MELDADAIIAGLAWTPDAQAADGRALIHIPLRVDAGHSGYRLDRFLASRFKRLSRSRIAIMVREGRVRALRNGTRLTKGAYRVREGESVVVSRPAPDDAEGRREYSVVHEDPDLLALDKPAGLAVHPTARYHNQTLTAAMRERLGAGHGWEMAHRLDRETSGVMVFGRAKGSGPLIKGAFFRREARKAYLAIVQGHVTAEHEVDIALGDAQGSKVRIKQGPRSLAQGGLPAHTQVEPLAQAEFRGGPVSLVRALPTTGRTHQIRVHLAQLGHSIVGDKLYGPDEQHFIDVADGERSEAEVAQELGLWRHALHAHTLRLPHPVSGESVTLRAPWPAELAEILPLP